MTALPDEYNQAWTDSILGKCEFFTDVRLWPLSAQLDPRQWLTNFGAAEQPYALRLLDGFLFFSKELVDAMFVAGFQAVSTFVSRPGSMPLAVQSAWVQFCSDVVITYVEGEVPNVTDSGYVFARRARQLLGIPETQIVSPDEALSIVTQSPHFPVVFLDDFVGSGHQFVTTWTRTRQSRGGATSSFELAARNPLGKFFYCPLLCTSKGATHIRDNCARLGLLPVHLLGPRDSVLGSESWFWPPSEQRDAYNAISNMSSRAGIPRSGKDRWDGYEGLGLAVAFEHSVPDATLPIFYWEQNGWKPLIRRS
jgi:hypothetical protein